jgi:hypothetical protein
MAECVNFASLTLELMEGNIACNVCGFLLWPAESNRQMEVSSHSRKPDVVGSALLEYSNYKIKNKRNEKIISGLHNRGSNRVVYRI